jgi:hypothetical protein
VADRGRRCRADDGALHAVAPFHLLFERAWARITAGDVPKYEQVKR